MNKLTLKWTALLFAAAMLAACAGQKEPASKAVADIEASIASMRDDASKYASTELQQAETGLASLKEQLANKDYKGVIASAPEISSRVTSLQQTIASKRDEVRVAMATASEEWKALSAELPDMVAALESRVGVLSQSKKLPKNVSADAFQAAKSGLESVKTTWTDATAAFGAGDPVKAVELARSAKQSGSAALQALGMG